MANTFVVGGGSINPSFNSGKGCQSLICINNAFNESNLFGNISADPSYPLINAFSPYYTSRFSTTRSSNMTINYTANLENFTHVAILCANALACNLKMTISVVTDTSTITKSVSAVADGKPMIIMISDDFKPVRVYSVSILLEFTAKPYIIALNGGLGWLTGTGFSVGGFGPIKRLAENNRFIAQNGYNNLPGYVYEKGRQTKGTIRSIRYDAVFEQNWQKLQDLSIKGTPFFFVWSLKRLDQCIYGTMPHTELADPVHTSNMLHDMNVTVEGWA